MLDFNGTNGSDCRPPAPFGATTAFLITHMSLFMAVLGVPANIFSLLVLRRDPSKTTTRVILMALALEDLALIFIYLIYYVFQNYIEIYKVKAFAPIRHAESPLLFILNWCKVVEIYTIVLVSLDRYIAIRFPLRAVTLCRVSNALRGLVIIALVSLIIKLPNLILDFKLVYWDFDCKSYHMQGVFTHHAWHVTFSLVYIQIMDQVFTFLIPLISLIVLNTCLILRIRGADNERCSLHGAKSMSTASSGSNLPMFSKTSTDRSGDTVANRQAAQRRNVTLTLIGVITIFIICETPTSLFFFNTIFYLIRDGNDVKASSFNEGVYPAALLLMFINCASNFFVYILIGRKFRNLFVHLFCRCFLSDKGLRDGHTTVYSRMPLRTQMNNNGVSDVDDSIVLGQMNSSIDGRKPSSKTLTTDCYLTSV